MSLRPVIALVATALASACAPSVAPPLGNGHEDDTTPSRGGWLHLASSTDIRSLDPAIAFDENSMIVENFVYATLVAFAPGGVVEPDLAESWQRSADGLRYVFHLRANARFHDGTIVRASDVKRSLERALHPETPCPAASFYARIRGYDAFASRAANELEGVRVEGDAVVAIELSEPDATLLAAMALPIASIVCPSAGTRYAPDFSARACGAGPFRVAAWEPGRRIALERFDGYFRPGLPYLDGVEWALQVPAFTQRLKFERGDLDFVRELSYSDGWLYRRDPRWRGRVAWEPGRETRGVFMNAGREPFSNVEMRRAVAAAIDREQLAALRPDVLKPASRILPPAMPGYDPSQGQRFDYAAALEHMRKAGYAYEPATGTGGYPYELDFVTPGGPTLGVLVAQVFQQQLARVGIRLRIRQLGYAAYLSEIGRRGATTLGSDSYGMDIPDPSAFYEALFSRAAGTNDSSQNHAFYASARFDALLADARREPTWERRLALYRDAEAILDDEAPWAIAYRYDWFELWHPYVRGYVINPLATAQLRFAWVDPGARATAHAREAWSAPFGAVARLFRDGQSRP